MTNIEISAQQPSTASPRRQPLSAGGRTRFRAIASVVIVAAVALIAWLALRDGGASTPATPNAPTAVTAAQLETLAASVGHPIFWLGPKEATTYELVRASNGAIYVRYLPKGTEVGSKEAYLTVATYPYAGAYAAVDDVLDQNGSTRIPLENGGVAQTTTKTPTNVHFAFPTVDYQGEVYDPTPGNAAALLRDGKLVVVGGLASGVAAGTPAPATEADLEAAAATLEHPVYWLGDRAGRRAEITRAANGTVTVRYLPTSTKLGAAGAFLTVGTYPYPDALAAIEALAKQDGAQAIELAGGGLAVVDKGRPTNVHLAYPGSDVQVEVYSPKADLARALVAAGALASVD